MKTPTLVVLIYCICIYINLGNSKSLKDYHSNSISHLKGPRKPLASPVRLNSLNDDSYKRKKREVSPAVRGLQQVISTAKLECVREMNMSPDVMEKSLLHAEHATREEKCLIMCLLKKLKLMDDSNKLSIKDIGRVASMLSDNNELVVSVAQEAGNQCNALLGMQEPCEAAYRINKCITKELKAHKMQLFY